jgi:hypothetical protein
MYGHHIIRSVHIHMPIHSNQPAPLFPARSLQVNGPTVERHTHQLRAFTTARPRSTVQAPRLHSSHRRPRSPCCAVLLPVALSFTCRGAKPICPLRSRSDRAASLGMPGVYSGVRTYRHHSERRCPTELEQSLKLECVAEGGLWGGEGDNPQLVVATRRMTIQGNRDWASALTCSVGAVLSCGHGVSMGCLLVTEHGVRVIGRRWRRGSSHGGSGASLPHRDRHTPGLARAHATLCLTAMLAGAHPLRGMGGVAMRRSCHAANDELLLAWLAWLLAEHSGAGVDRRWG